MRKISSLKEKWEILVAKLTHQFAEGDELNMDGIIYLIGVQELGQSHREFKKDEKVNLIIASFMSTVCSPGLRFGSAVTVL